MDEGRKETEPLEVIRAKSDWIGEDEDVGFISKFLLDYTITNNECDYVESSEIEQWITNKKLGISSKKFAMEMKKYCILKKHDVVVSKYKKLCGKTKKVWVGMQLTLEEDEEL
jgi:hypothetical protein